MRCLQFGQNLEELAHGVRPGHADILVLEHEEIAIPRPGLFLPRSAQVQLDQCLLIGQLTALGPDDDNFSEVIESAPRSHDIAMPPPGREAVEQAAQNAPGS